jgi:hypothetical protein
METILNLLQVFKPEKLIYHVPGAVFVVESDKNFQFVDVFHCAMDVKAVKFT